MDLQNTPITMYSVFPEEIWLLILEKLDNISLQSYAESIPDFARILEKSKSKWLFQFVLPFLTDKLRFSDLLSCRLVCSRWRSAINYYWETVVSSNYDPFQLPKLLQTFIFNYPLSKSSKHNITKYSSMSTIPGGAVTVTNLEQEPSELFGLFGNITNLKISSKYNRRSPFYPVLCEILHLSPTIKSLSVNDDITSYNETEDKNHNFPSLPHLKCLETYIHPNSWMEVKLVQTYSNQLTKLTLRQWHCDLNKFSWNSLIFLEVKLHSDCSLFNCLRNLDAVNLKHLVVPFNSNLKHLVDLTHKFVLTSLCLKSPSSFRGISKSELDSLPSSATAKAETLYLKTFPFVDYSYLKVFAKTMTVKIAIHNCSMMTYIREGTYCPYQMYSLIRNHESLYKSQIWNDLRELRKLEIWTFNGLCRKQYYYRPERKQILM